MGKRQPRLLRQDFEFSARSFDIAPNLKDITLLAQAWRFERHRGVRAEHATQRAATMPPRAPLVRADGARGTYSGLRGSVGVIDAFDEFSGDEYSRKLYTQLAKLSLIHI